MDFAVNRLLAQSVLAWPERVEPEKAKGSERLGLDSGRRLSHRAEDEETNFSL
jgi:hypothetical protein